MTPGGNPTSSRIRTISTTVSGSWAAGFTTTVFPMASAGATLPAMLTRGKLYDVMHATTPTGWRSASALMSPPGASGVATATCGGGRAGPRARRSSEYRSKRLTAIGTCRLDPTAAVAPVSAITSGSSSSARAEMACAARAMSAARSAGGVADHPGKASRAAAAAASASATVALGAWPTTSSVAGFTTS